MPEKSYTRGLVWRVSFEEGGAPDDAVISGCFAQKASGKRSAACDFNKVDDRTYDVTWKQEVGYKAAYSWFQNTVASMKGRKKVKWSFRLACVALVEPVGSAQERSGASPQISGGVAGDVLLKEKGASPEERGKPGEVKKPKMNQSGVSPSQAAASAPLNMQGVSPAASVGSLHSRSSGDSPRECSEETWLVQKALKLFCGCVLDDPAAKDYRITGVSPLCKTAHSTTFMVHVPKRGDLVIKALHRDVSSTFLMEVDFLSRLQHPNIVKLLDVAKMEDGRCCMVTSFGGHDLCSRINDMKGGSPYPQMGLLVDQLLAAVGHVHRCRVVHSDLKPGNIVVSEDRVLRLIDFGCAFVESSGHRTKRTFDEAEKKGIRYGTLPYRAIEVVLGKIGFGRPMDIWSIGCIVFELVVCSRLFGISYKDADDIARGCFAQLGQQDKIGCLAALPRWKSRFVVETSTADFWCRMGGSPAGLAYSEFVFSMLDINDKERPDIGQLQKTWTDLDLQNKY